MSTYHMFFAGESLTMLTDRQIRNRVIAAPDARARAVYVAEQRRRVRAFYARVTKQGV